MKNPVTRQLAAVALTLSIAATPAFALAQTTSITTDISALRAQIESLLKQIETLREQLKNRVRSSETSSGNASTTPSGLLFTCPSPERNLGLGSRGDDVRELQEFLAEDPTLFSKEAVSGYFGPLTLEAVRTLQERQGIASTSTGFVGPITRDFFEKRCGEILGERRGEDRKASTTPELDDRSGPNRGPGIGTSTDSSDDLDDDGDDDDDDQDDIDDD